MIAYAPCLCFISVNLLAVRSILFKTKLFIILHSHIFVISFSFVLLIKFSARLMFAFDFECCVWFICLPLWDWILYTGYYIYISHLAYGALWHLAFGSWPGLDVFARSHQSQRNTLCAARCTLIVSAFQISYFMFHISHFAHCNRLYLL